MTSDNKHLEIDLGSYSNMVEFTEDQDGDDVYLKLNAAYNFMKDDRELAKQIRLKMADFSKLLFNTQNTFNDNDTSDNIKFKLVIDYNEAGLNESNKNRKEQESIPY